MDEKYKVREGPKAIKHCFSAACQMVRYRLKNGKALAKSVFWIRVKQTQLNF